MIYVRLYINPTTRKVELCETDQLPIKRPPVIVHNIDENQQPIEQREYKIVELEIEDLQGKIFQLDAREFAEDLSDDGEARFGQSIVKINDDFSVSFCNNKAQHNKGAIKECNRFRIRKCEVK